MRSMAVWITPHATSARHGSGRARPLGAAEVSALRDGVALAAVREVTATSVALGTGVGVAPMRVTSPQLARSSARARSGTRRPTVTGYRGEREGPADRAGG